MKHSTATRAARKAALEHELAVPFFITLDANGEIADPHVRNSAARNMIAAAPPNTTCSASGRDHCVAAAR